MVAPLNISLSSIGFLPNLQVLDHIDQSFHRVTVRAQPAPASVSCTGCGTPSCRVHGAYWRSLGDVACFERPTVLLIRVRRFRCSNAACPRRTFAEPLPGVARPRARQTDRLRVVHRTISLALGGNPGSRHARAMGVPISRTTLGHLVSVGTDMAAAPVTVLGVDDWAWRKGRRYGTILCDLERRRVIDLLPDRGADTLATWLETHPSVTVVVCDSAGAYAKGTARGAPDALQIADRWHLLRNASDALRGVLEHHHRDLRATARTAAAPLEPPAETREAPQPVAPEPDRPLRSTERRARAGQERRDARYAEAVRLRGQGLSIRAVARSLGVERKTVRRWLRADHAPTWRHADCGTSILNPYHGYLEDRWQAGCHNTAALWRELQERGFPGQYGVVRDWGTRRRRQDPPAGPRGTSDKPVPVKLPEPPTPRRAVRLLVGDPDRLTDEDRRFVQALRERSPSITTAADLVTCFCEMVKSKLSDPF